VHTIILKRKLFDNCIFPFLKVASQINMFLTLTKTKVEYLQARQAIFQWNIYLVKGRKIKTSQLNRVCKSRPNVPILKLRFKPYLNNCWPLLTETGLQDSKENILL